MFHYSPYSRKWPGCHRKVAFRLKNASHILLVPQGEASIYQDRRGSRKAGRESLYEEAKARGPAPLRTCLQHSNVASLGSASNHAAPHCTAVRNSFHLHLCTVPHTQDPARAGLSPRCLGPPRASFTKDVQTASINHVSYGSHARMYEYPHQARPGRIPVVLGSGHLSSPAQVQRGTVAKVAHGYELVHE